MLRQPNLANWKQLVKALRDFSADAAIQILPVTSSLTPKGPDLGSDTTLDMVAANPALIVGAGTNAYTAGSLWHHLDVRIKQPTTLIDTVNFTAANLQDYSVVILPDGKYGLWHAAHATKLRQYLEGGGVVIAVCNSVDWLKNNGVIKMNQPKHQDDTNGSATSLATNESPKKRFGDARNDAALESIAGAMFRTEIDSTHPLSYGFPNDTVPVFRRGTYTYTPPENSYQTAAIYGDVIAGYVSEKNRKHLKELGRLYGSSGQRACDRFVTIRFSGATYDQLSHSLPTQCIWGQASKSPGLQLTSTNTETFIQKQRILVGFRMPMRAAHGCLVRATACWQPNQLIKGNH